MWDSIQVLQKQAYRLVEVEQDTHHCYSTVQYSTVQYKCDAKVLQKRTGWSSSSRTSTTWPLAMRV